jgi:hypothetical protein
MGFCSLAPTGGKGLQADKPTGEFMQAFPHGEAVPPELPLGPALAPWAEFLDGPRHKEPPRTVFEGLGRLHEQGFEGIGQFHRARSRSGYTQRISMRLSARAVEYFNFRESLRQADLGGVAHISQMVAVYHVGLTLIDVEELVEVREHWHGCASPVVRRWVGNGQEILTYFARCALLQTAIN